MIGDLIGEWIKGILIDGIMGNLSGLFNTVNTKVGEIASDVGSLSLIHISLPCLMCRSLEQILAMVTFTMASRSCCSTGFGFSIRANVPSET